MTFRPPSFPGWILVAACLAGCSTVHDVTVDAISDRSKPMGSSFHLEVNDPAGGVNPELHEAVVAMIKDALAARGLFEVPASVRPDMMIEGSYGVGHGYVKIVTETNMGVLLGPTGAPQNNSKAVVVFDKTLELTGRAVVPTPAASGTAGQPGEELWSIKAKIVDTKQELMPYVPALASACIDYIGENPGRELTFPVDSAHAQVLLQQRAPTSGAPAIPAKK
jgi:hypothetical protein